MHVGDRRAHITACALAAIILTALLCGPALFAQEGPAPEPTPTPPPAAPAASSAPPAEPAPASDASTPTATPSLPGTATQPPSAQPAGAEAGATADGAPDGGQSPEPDATSGSGATTAADGPTETDGSAAAAEATDPPLLEPALTITNADAALDGPTLDGGDSSSDSVASGGTAASSGSGDSTEASERQSAARAAARRREVRQRREQAISQSIERLGTVEAAGMSAAQKAALVGQVAQGARVDLGALREETAGARLALEHLQRTAREIKRDRRTVPGQVRAGQIPSLGAQNRWDDLKERNAELEDAIDTAFGERLRLLTNIPLAEQDLSKVGSLRESMASDLDQSLREVLSDADDYLTQRLKAMQALLELYNEQASVATEAYDESSRYAEDLSAAIVAARQRGLLARSQDRLSTATFTTLASGATSLLGDGELIAHQYAESGRPPRTMPDFVLRLVGSLLLLAALVLLWGRLPEWLRRAFMSASPAAAGEAHDTDPGVLRDCREAELATPVARAVLLAAVAWAGLHVWGLPPDWVVAALSLLGTWAAYFALLAVMRELLAPRHEQLRVIPIDNDAARALYRLFRGLALWSAIMLPIIWALGSLDYRAEDVLVLLSVVHVCGLAAIAGWLIYAQGGPGEFVDAAEGSTSRPVRRIVTAAVPILLGASASVAVLKAFGYVNLGGHLARILYVDIPLAIVALVADWQLRRHVAAGSGWRRWSRVALWSAVGIAQIWVLQLRWHHWQELLDLLKRPLFTVAQSEISAFSFARAAVVAVLAWLIARLLRRWLSSSERLRNRLSEGVQYALSSLVFYVILIGGILWAMLAGGFPLNALTVLAGMAGIGLGFGLQDVVRNFVAGLILLIERPLAVGDYIEVAGTWGRVMSISLRSTVVRTQDNAHILVPNGDIISNQLTNLSHRDRTLRLVIPVGVAYDSDIDRVREVLTQVAKEQPNVRDFPEPDARLAEFGDSAIVLELLAWISDPSVQTSTTVGLNLAIWRALKLEGIEIPFPQQDLHLRSASVPLQIERDEPQDR